MQSTSTIIFVTLCFVNSADKINVTILKYKQMGTFNPSNNRIRACDEKSLQLVNTSFRSLLFQNIIIIMPF